MALPVVDLARLREVCVEKELHVFRFTDSLSHARAHMGHCREVCNVLIPLAGIWREDLPAQVPQLVAAFLLPAAFTWTSYPELEGADNDPALPHHVGHWLEPTLRPFPAGPVEERARMLVKNRLLDVQLEFIASEFSALAPRLAFWSGLVQTLQNRLVGVRFFTI